MTRLNLTFTNKQLDEWWCRVTALMSWCDPQVPSLYLVLYDSGTLWKLVLRLYTLCQQVSYVHSSWVGLNYYGIWDTLLDNVKGPMMYVYW